MSAPASTRLLDLRERFAFDLDAQRVRRDFRARPRSPRDRARRGDVVVLDQHAAIEAEAMVGAAAACAPRTSRWRAAPDASCAYRRSSRGCRLIASTYRCVAVAMPDISWTKLSAMRSPVSRPARSPSIFATTSPLMQLRALGGERTDLRRRRRSMRRRARAGSRRRKPSVGLLDGDSRASVLSRLARSRQW